MSTFYRTIHREKLLQEVEDSSNKTTNGNPIIPLFATMISPCLQSRMKSTSVAEASTILPPLRLFVSLANGLIHAYKLVERTKWKPSESLLSTNSAIQLIHTHVYLPEQQTVYPLPPSLSSSKDQDIRMISLGSKCIDVIRNYTGEDVNAGGEVFVSLRLDGKVTIYIREEQPFYIEADPTKSQELSNNTSVPIVRPTYEFHIQDAVGTTMALIPPRQCGYSKDGVCILVGCLDGSVIMVSTGVAIPTVLKVSEKTTNITSTTSTSSLECGKVIDTIGEGNSIPTALAVHPNLPYTFAVGRKDGIIDLYSTVIVDDLSSYNHSYGTFRRIHRLTHPASVPIRALSYTPDGCLLLVGNDDGTIFIYDTSSPKQRTIRLVGSIFGAHKGFILSIATLPDSKRFFSSSVDKTVKVWDVASPYSGPLHTFDAGHVDLIWGVATSHDGRRCVSCGDDGLLQVYACE